MTSKQQAAEPVANAKRTMIGIEIPRDQLAFRIAQAAIGIPAPAGTSPKQALDAMDRLALLDPHQPAMGEGFRRAADQAVLFFHECINAGRQPS